MPIGDQDVIGTYSNYGRVFVEIHNLDETDHGGPGWGLGTCLWSPARNATDGDRYSLMRQPEPGNLVLHFTKARWPDGSSERRLYATSVVDDRVSLVNESPPNPGKSWSNREQYYRIPLREFKVLSNPLSLDHFFIKYGNQLQSVLTDAKARGVSVPFDMRKDGYRASAGLYLRECDEQLFNLLMSALAGNDGSGIGEPIEYLARLCWNTRRWESPSGDAKDLEQWDTFACTNGFGHEEWLFRLEWLIDGYHYGFIQGLNREATRNRHRHFPITVHLYARSPIPVDVGMISRCDVLTSYQANEALMAYRRNGWIDQMAAEVESIKGGNSKAITGETDPHLFFNVRFKPEDFDLYDPPEVSPHGSPQTKFPRYSLRSLTSDERPAHRSRRGRRSTDHQPEHSSKRRAIPATEIDRRHNKLQNKLNDILCSIYGDECVSMECDWADIRVQIEPDSEIILEVKTHNTARHAIREAIGQLLFYALYDRRDVVCPQLLVVAPPPLKPEDISFLRDLRGLGVPIDYRQFTPDMDSFQI